MKHPLIKLLNNPKTLNLKKREILYHQGDVPSSVFIIKKGLMGLFNLSDSGKETFLRTFCENDLIGHRSYLAGENYHATSVALSVAEIIVIGREECEKICFDNPDILLNVAKHLAKDLKNAELRLSGVQDQSAQRRVVESLIFLKLRHPEHVWGRKEIAEHSASTIETVARTLTRLEKENLLLKKGRDLEIDNFDKLLQFSKSHF